MTTSTPPHDMAAEQAILGAVLRVAQDNTDQAAELLTHTPTPSDYYRPQHETLATHLAAAAANGRALDPAAILGRLQDAGDLKPEWLDGPYIHTLLTNAAPTSSIGWHTARVQQLAHKRRAITALQRALQRVTNADEHDIGAVYEAMSDLEDLTQTVRGTTPTSWAPLNLEAALQGRDNDPPPTLLPRTDGPCLIYGGAIHTLSGEPESGKTWIALHAAADQLATGNHVTIIDFEDRETRVVARLLALGAHPNHIRTQLHYIRPHEAIDQRGRTALEQAATRSTLTILDGVTEAMTLHGLELEKNKDIAQFYALLPRWIANCGPAVILIDHVVKDSEKQGRWGIGGQHKLAGIDGVAYLIKTVEPFGRGKRGTSRVVVSKDRPGHVREHAVGHTAAEFHLDATHPDILRATLDPPTELPKDDHGDIRPTILMERVSRFLELSQGVSRKAIEDGVKGKRDYVRKAVDCLIHEGYVEIEKGPRNTQIHRSLTPFRNEPDDVE